MKKFARIIGTGSYLPSKVVTNFDLEKILDTYLEVRQPEEMFVDTYQRVGLGPFKERVYVKAD